MALDHNLQFIGWQSSPLPTAATALFDGLGEALADTLIAVPGARAGRSLMEHLRRGARERGLADWAPPRILTQGRLIDELALVVEPRADRTTRTLAWERALRETLGGGGEQNLLGRAPASDDRAAWWRLAERVRSLHADLAVEGKGFSDLAQGNAELFGGEGELAQRERARWATLARAQAQYRELLSREGFVDPHEARNAAIQAGRVLREARVALVGVADAQTMLRRSLQQLDAPPHVLVIAPEEERASFDELGFLVPGAWTQRELEIPLERWHVVTGPQDQAELAARLIARPGGPRTASAVTIGLVDEEVLPYLERRFAADQVRARAASSSTLERSAPARLLSAFARWLDGRSASAAAELVRHPDLERWLAHNNPREGAALDAPALLDAQRARHLPAHFGGELPFKTSPPRRKQLEAMSAALLTLAGPLAGERELSLADAAGATRALLVEVYDLRELGPAPPERAQEERERRELRAALAALGELCGDLGEVPASIAGGFPPSTALELCVRCLQGTPLPPAPARADEPVVEVLGWLELALDDAPELVVTGFAEGLVPATRGADPFLPDSLRGELGLEDETRRLARDAYATQVLLSSRERVDFISARRTREGDSLFPSRLAFHAHPREAPARMQHALHPLALPKAENEESRSSYVPPDLSQHDPPEVFSVTDFKAYLDSPYLYALTRLWRLESLDDGLRELDARGFGTLLHHALEALREEELARCTDADDLRSALLSRLETRVREQYGAQPLPAIAMQMRQAARRLEGFAEWQAGRAADGWIVRHVEWTPPDDRGAARGERRTGNVPLPLGTQEPAAWLQGKIDRIDQHEDGRWAILDYKAGRKQVMAKDALGRVTKAMRKSGERGAWKDPQLPLYCLLAEPLLGAWQQAGKLPQLGYISLTPEGTFIDCADSWERDDLLGAIERACEIVRSIRAGELQGLGKGRIYDPLVAELVGVGLVSDPGTAEEEPEGEA